MASEYEAHLILAARKGDQEAFNELVLLNQDAVYNLAYRLSGEADLAEDITQDTFLIAYRSLPGFRNGSFKSWLIRIATNACYDEFRRRKRHPVAPIETEDRSEENLIARYDWPVPQLSPEQWIMQHEFEQTIQQALNMLDPDQRVVVVLADLQEMDYLEVAQVLRIPIGTVKSRLARGRRVLRQLLIQEDVGIGVSIPAINQPVMSLPRG